MANFEAFAKAIHRRYMSMAEHELFVVDIDGDILWQHYLASFPEGTNPIYRERTEHDCSCCRNFIKNLGNVVIIDGEVNTIWEVEGLEYPYDVVAMSMANFVRSGEVSGLFRSKEHHYGAQTSKELLDSGDVKIWKHFWGDVGIKHFSQTPDAARGQYATSAQVFARGLTELTFDALDTAIDLIEQKALYRGEEFLAALKEFRTLKRAYDACISAMKPAFVWLNAENRASRFRNTAMGTLIQDLSGGMELDAAVRSFEAKVAPTNYKRPTALITKGMIEQAMKTIDALGLEPALARRHAKLSDVNVNDVLWVDRSVRGQMKGGIAELLGSAVKPAEVDTKHAMDIDVESFMADILPTAAQLDVLLQNKHAGKFVSVTAPVHADCARLFKWDNNFAWSYNGNITDAIKERVKKAGGAVDGDLCCRLAWDYTDDLDFHMYEPNGYRIYFYNRRTLSPNGGVLDLDANGMDGIRTDPAENIVYADRRKMRAGEYVLIVNNYNRRSDGAGFTVQVEFDGQVHQLEYPSVLRSGESVEVARIKPYNGTFAIDPKIRSTTLSKDVWGIKTETFAKVNTVMLSPNYWSGSAIGNKHWLFLLDGCKNPEPARGIYNEFLRGDLDKHRKVFEVLGSKTKCEPTDEQLSGVGFSSTQEGEVTVRVVTSRATRLYNVKFN